MSRHERFSSTSSRRSSAPSASGDSVLSRSFSDRSFNRSAWKNESESKKKLDAAHLTQTFRQFNVAQITDLASVRPQDTRDPREAMWNSRRAR